MRQIAAAKQVIYEGFTTAIASDFPWHIEAVHPTFSKVLVRYNPEGDSVLNRRQSQRLQQLSDYLRNKSRSMFMFELLVPAEKSQLEQVRGDRQSYDSQLRPHLMVEAIKQLQDSRVEPDVWKVEGLDRTQDCEKVVDAARRNGRDRVGCIILGRGEDDTRVGKWLATASQVPGFIGFAVGRTVFWEPLMNFRTKKITRDQAVADIARRYRECVDIFQFGKMRAA